MLIKLALDVLTQSKLIFVLCVNVGFLVSGARKMIYPELDVCD
jgi:hypothetical protein